MTVDVKIKTNAPKLQARYSKFLKKLPRVITKGVDQAGANLLTIIKHKTTRGEKYTSGRFPAYSPEYSALKGKTTVDLQDSNDMLNSMASKMINKNTSRLYFRSQYEARKAYWHQVGAGNLPERPFFGANKKVEKVLQRNFEKLIATELRRFNA